MTCVDVFFSRQNRRSKNNQKASKINSSHMNFLVVFITIATITRHKNIKRESSQKAA